MHRDVAAVSGMTCLLPAGACGDDTGTAGTGGGGGASSGAGGSEPSGGAGGEGPLGDQSATCREGRVAARGTSPDDARCAVCAEDAGRDGATPRCVEGGCVACAADGDCAEPAAPLCGAASACEADPRYGCTIDAFRVAFCPDLDQACAESACLDELAGVFGPGGRCETSATCNGCIEESEADPLTACLAGCCS